MSNNQKSPMARAIASVFSIGVVVLIWSVSYHIVRHARPEKVSTSPELATLLFGASAIALFIFSLVVVALALVGWKSLLIAVREEATTTVKEELASMRNELRGRSLSILGYMLGEMNTRSDSLEPADKDGIAEAVRLCQQGYDFLKKLGGAPEFMSLNNLIYYSCVEGDRSRSDFILKSARRLMDAGQEHDVANLQLTACRAILQYGTDREERQRAHELLAELANKRNIPTRERREARFYMDSFPEN
jgi:hypothetical protein